MLKEKLILTDVDGVLLDWNIAFDDFMEERNIYRIPDTDSHYNLNHRYDAKISTIRPFVKEFNNSEKMKNLKPLLDSVEYVEKLVNDGFRFVAITSLSDDPATKIFRSENLVNIFGDVFDDVICLKTGASKEVPLAKWAGSGLFWLEDHFTHAEEGYEEGLKSILISTTYNSHFQTDLFPRTSFAHPWRDIYRLVCKHYGLKDGWE